MGEERAKIKQKARRIAASEGIITVDDLARIGIASQDIVTTVVVNPVVPAMDNARLKCCLSRREVIGFLISFASRLLPLSCHACYRENYALWHLYASPSKLLIRHIRPRWL